MLNNAITVGTPTSTGGKVLTGNAGIKMNGKDVSVVGDIASCACGSKSCRGQGPILQGSPRNTILNGRPIAMTQDPVDTGCGNCFVLSSGDQVSLGGQTSAGVNLGSGVNIGNGVNINIGGGVNVGRASAQAVSSSSSVTSSMSNATAVPSSSIPKINPNNMYWPPYNFLAKEGEKEVQVEYLIPPQSLAIFSVEEAKEFLQNLYDDMGGKDAISDAKSYKDLGFSGKEAIETAKGLGGLGVMAYTKNINGKDWIIIKNFKKHLKTLEKGHKWGANNPRIIQLGLGLNDLKGAMRYVRFNAGLEVAFSIGLNAADYILRDDATLAELGVNSAADITKGFIALVGAGIATAMLPATATVLLSGAVFAGMSFIISQGLNSVDKKTGFSKDLTHAVEEYFK